MISYGSVDDVVLSPAISVLECEDGRVKDAREDVTFCAKGLNAFQHEIMAVGVSKRSSTQAYWEAEIVEPVRDCRWEFRNGSALALEGGCMTAWVRNHGRSLGCTPSLSFPLPWWSTEAVDCSVRASFPTLPLQGAASSHLDRPRSYRGNECHLLVHPTGGIFNTYDTAIAVCRAS